MLLKARRSIGGVLNQSKKSPRRQPSGFVRRVLKGLPIVPMAALLLSAAGDPVHGQAAGDCAQAETHWKSAEAIGSREVYEDHLKRFPTCAFAVLARARIASLAQKGAGSNPPTAAPAACTSEQRAQIQKDLVGKWQFYSGGERMCHGEIFRDDGRFISFDKDCAVKVLAPDSTKYGSWSVDAECRVLQVFDESSKNLIGDRGRYAAMTPVFKGRDRFIFKETFVKGDTYYQRE